MDEELTDQTNKEIDEKIEGLQTKKTLAKEDSFVSLIIRIIVKSTLKEYYEKSNKVP